MAHSIIDETDFGIVQSPPGRMTEDEFLTWVDDPSRSEWIRAEWVNGEVIVMSPASVKHVLITDWISRVLGIFVEEKQLGKVLTSELAIRLRNIGISFREPDIVFISTADLGNLRKNHLEGAPEFLIEVVSPDSVDRDWRNKYREYEAAGVGEYWIVDPLTETFQANVRNLAGKYEPLALDANGAIHAVSVPGFWIKPAWLWQPQLPGVLQSLRELGVVS